VTCTRIEQVGAVTNLIASLAGDGRCQSEPRAPPRSAGGQADHGDGDHEHTTQIMAEHVVVLTPPQQRMRTIAGEELYDNPQPIDVRHDPGEGHHGAICACARKKKTYEGRNKSKADSDMRLGPSQRLGIRGARRGMG
jgi:hypothetical protein